MNVTPDPPLVVIETSPNRCMQQLWGWRGAGVPQQPRFGTTGPPIRTDVGWQLMGVLPVSRARQQCNSVRQLGSSAMGNNAFGRQIVCPGRPPGPPGGRQGLAGAYLDHGSRQQ